MCKYLLVGTSDIILGRRSLITPVDTGHDVSTYIFVVWTTHITCNKW